jgi:hypothetical protein
LPRAETPRPWSTLEKYALRTIKFREKNESDSTPIGHARSSEKHEEEAAQKFGEGGILVQLPDVFLQVGKREILENGGHDDARSHVVQEKDLFSRCLGVTDSRRRWEIAKLASGATGRHELQHAVAAGRGCGSTASTKVEHKCSSSSRLSSQSDAESFITDVEGR